MIEFILATGDPIALKTVTARKFKGTRLPGTNIYRADRDGYAILLQTHDQGQFQLSYREISCHREHWINTHERFKGWRLEAVLTGELNVRYENGPDLILLPNEYHVTNIPSFQSHYQAGKSCTYITIRFSNELAESFGKASVFTGIMPRTMPPAMRKLLLEMMENPWDHDTRLFYYDNCVRDIAFIHFNTPNLSPPGTLTEKERAACYAAEAFIRQNLEHHIKIEKLAKMVHSNTEVLKRGFMELFGVGVFRRLIDLRMERACKLLEETNMLINVIGYEAGYTDAASFVTAFKKYFAIAPREWRKNKRKGL